MYPLSQGERGQGCDCGERESIEASVAAGSEDVVTVGVDGRGRGESVFGWMS